MNSPSADARTGSRWWTNRPLSGNHASMQQASGGGGRRRRWPGHGWHRTAVPALSVLLATAVLSGCTSQPAVPPNTGTGAPTTNASTSTSTGPPASVSQPATAVSTAPVPGTTNPVATGPTVPAVVRLAWLGKRPKLDGVEVGVPSATRWQGTVPGEYALFGAKSSYQWFGADGSAVGCAAVGKCIGIDADGYTAVVQDGSTRLVYLPDGKALGRFAANGRRLGGAAVPSLSAAIVSSGVDLSGLLDRATRPIPYAGGIGGDPHVVTSAGLRYTTQLTGQFQARIGDPQRKVQVRLEQLAHQPNVSVVTAVAIEAEGSRLEYTEGGAATLDGQVLAAPQPFSLTVTPNGPRVGLWQADAERTRHAVVLWPDGSSVVMSANPDLGMTAVVVAPRVAGTSGLFGVGGFDTGTDLQNRGRLVTATDAAVRDWMVRPAETLFVEQVSAVSGFPSSPPVAPPAAAGFAEKSCRAGGISNASDLAACELDVGLTGDDGFVAGIVAVTRPTMQRISPAIAGRWPGLVLGSTATEQPLPAVIDIQAAAGSQALYTVPVAFRGAVRFEFVAVCKDGDPANPGPDVATARLFDAGGAAVSPRMRVCGQPQTPTLAPGNYHLEIAGPAAGAGQQVRVEIRRP